LKDAEGTVRLHYEETEQMRRTEYEEKLNEYQDDRNIHLEEYRKGRRETEEAKKKQDAVIREMKEKFAEQHLKKCLQENDELQETVEKLQNETETLKCKSDAGAAFEKFLWEKDVKQATGEKLQNESEEEEELQRADDKLQDETESFRDQSNIGMAMKYCLQEKPDLRNKMNELEGCEYFGRAAEADFDVENVEKEKSESMSKLEGEFRSVNEEMLKAEQEINPPDVTGKIYELENSLVKQLEEELDEAKNVYEDGESDMKTKDRDASHTETDTEMKYSILTMKIRKWKMNWKLKEEIYPKYIFKSKRCIE